MSSKRILLTALAAAFAAGAQTPVDQPPIQPGTQGSFEQLPVRVEFGASSSDVDHGLGPWNTIDTQIWFRGNHFFIPNFTVDSQTRPAGTQQNYAFFSYLNWTDSFYTTQGFSASAAHDPATTYYPRFRYDIKAYYKLPPKKHFVIGAGYTHFNLGPTGHGDIVNIGSLYYHNKLVLEGNLFINRSQPGNLWSASGTVSAQYGREGHYWLGSTFGAGRELYEYVGQTPFQVEFPSYSLNIFYRKWFTRHVGAVISFDLLDNATAYRQIGGTGHLFFEF
jgi:YaiO family outer membrane protein